MGIAAAIGYVLLYALSIWLLSSEPSFNSGESLAIFLIFGIGFSLIAWIATIGIQPGEFPVRKPGREFSAVMLYLAVFAILILGWGFSAVRASFPQEPQQSIAKQEILGFAARTQPL